MAGTEQAEQARESAGDGTVNRQGVVSGYPVPREVDAGFTVSERAVMAHNMAAAGGGNDGDGDGDSSPDSSSGLLGAAGAGRERSGSGEGGVAARVVGSGSLALAAGDLGRRRSASSDAVEQAENLLNR